MLRSQFLRGLGAALLMGLTASPLKVAFATTPQERMNRRYPQPVKAGFLIGLPVLDEKDSTYGYIREVVRTGDGKIVLVVPYRAWLGWAPTDWGRKDVAGPRRTGAPFAPPSAAPRFSAGAFS